MPGDGALVNCQYSMAAFSMSERKKRNRGDRKTTEATIHLHQALQSVIRTELLPKSQIDVFVEVRSIYEPVFSLSLGLTDGASRFFRLSWSCIQNALH